MWYPTPEHFHLDVAMPCWDIKGGIPPGWEVTKFSIAQGVCVESIILLVSRWEKYLSFFWGGHGFSHKSWFSGKLS